MNPNQNRWPQGGDSVGVGIAIREDQGRIVIGLVAPGGPAEQLGIQPEDELFKVDDFPCRGASLDEVTNRVRGPAGSQVVLQVGRGNRLITVVVPRAAPLQTPPTAPRSPSAPAAPIAPPWLSPLPQPNRERVTRGATRLTRQVILDPQVNNCPGFEYVVPEGWESQGEIVWDHDSSLLATVRLTIVDPASGARVQWLPTAHFAFTPHPPLPIAPGTNWMGGLFFPPPQHPADFVQMFWGQRELGHVRGVRPAAIENRPQIAAEFTRGQPGWQAQAVRLRYDYDQQGQPWSEDVSFVLNYAPQRDPSVMNWNVQNAVAVRAPRAALAAREPLFHAIAVNAGFTTEWLATYSICRQLFQQRMREWIIDNQRFGQQLAQYRDHIARLSQQMHEERMQSFDRIAASQREYLGGVETYRDPHDGRGVYLPAGYKEYWVNPQGEMLLMEEVGHDPNLGATERWSRMERIHPLDARW